MPYAVSRIPYLGYGAGVEYTNKWWLSNKSVFSLLRLRTTLQGLVQPCQGSPAEESICFTLPSFVRPTSLA
jgi:hypothetical protein